MSLPAADDLFRGNRPMTAVPDEPQALDSTTSTPRKPSGRVRHDEKMTVYVTADELLDIEHARLSLRRHQGLAVDRGRLVRYDAHRGLGARLGRRGFTLRGAPGP